MCIRKYGDPTVWKCFNDVFDYMTISALIEEKIFIVHGGLSPSIHSLNEIRSLTVLRKSEAYPIFILG